MGKIYNMKRVIFFTILLSLLSCINSDKNNKLRLFLQNFDTDINRYKVICFIPVDGCYTCINPAIDLSKNPNKGLLIILSSIYQKSIDEVIEFGKIKTENVTDNKNLAVNMGLVTNIAPCYYFLKNGKIKRIFDISTTYDKTSIISEVEKYLLN